MPKFIPQKKGQPAVSAAVTKAKNIRRDVAQASSLVVKEPLNALSMTFDVAVVRAKEYIGAGLQALTAAVAMKDLTPPDLSSLHTYIKSTGDAIEEAGKFARARVLDVVLAQGAAIGESGKSRELDLGNGMVQRITIQKTGVDPKKFEAALRAKGATVTKYMATEVSYSMLEGNQSQDRALQDGLFTQGELDAMNYPPSYRVDRMTEKKGGS